MFAVRCFQQEELIVDGIAKGNALAFGEAGNGVEKDLFAFAGELKVPSLAAVGGFVDPGFVPVAAGHHVGGEGIERDDSAKIQGVAVGDRKA